ncbi:XaxA [Photorhabdus laumondii subsp. clarkei]|uniref:XaxA n=2 Tax=Photorhabdus TaxID=29487 RepID=A0A329VNK7_9GAMM|nr:XaxA [Photorhabdus laumondii subsp. clarkei]
MDNNMLLNQSLEENKLPNSEVPAATLNILTGQVQGAARSAGIFTKEDLINIKLYVKNGLELPFTLPTVKEYIHYNDTNIEGLKPENIKTLFEEIHNHALSWSKVEDKVQRQSIDLENAGKQITQKGESIIKIIEKMPITDSIETLKNTYNNLKPTNEQLFKITYTDVDKKVAVGLKSILESMEKDVKGYRENSQQVKDAITDFKITLFGGTLSDGKTADGLLPQVDTKKKLMDDNNLSTTVKELQDEINEKKRDIEQLQKDYDQYVKLSLSGAISVIGVVITGSIFGPKAENARKQKNELIEKVKELQEQIKGASALQTALQNLSLHFLNIRSCMQDAEVALKHLDVMWSTMLEQINLSKKSFAEIDNASMLLMFEETFKQAISPWKEVQGSAEKLVKIFDEALAEYKKRSK